MSTSNLKPQTSNLPKGFTAIELLLVIAATAVLSGLVSIPLSLLQTGQGLTASVSSVVNGLRRAQTEAMTGYYGTKWGVHFAASTNCGLPTKRFWVYRSDVFDSASDTSDVIDLPNGSRITALSLAGGGCNAYFQRFSGSTTTTGTVTITDPNGTSKVIGINSYGLISPP